MALELRQQLKLTQQLTMTPQLQMAIKLLQLSTLELSTKIQQELQENPALEEIPEIKDDSFMEKNESSEESLYPETSLYNETNDESFRQEIPSDFKELPIEKVPNAEIDWNNYFEDHYSNGRYNFESEEKDAPKYEAFIAKKESLQDHLLWQLSMADLPEQEEIIGSGIIGNIDKDGYLDANIEEISKLCNADQKNVEKVLSLIQTFDPIGVGARNLTECLLIQIKYLNLDNPIIKDIIQNHIKHLENKNYNAIAKSLKSKVEDVIVAVKIIRGLEPKPGRTFSDYEPHYINPDIYVYNIEEKFIIVLNDSGMPKLRVSDYLKNVIKNGNNKVNENAKEYIQEKLSSASWLIRSIEQRKKTIYKVMESIVKFQKNFFEKGIDYLNPMILKDVAQDINMHESTISRVTSNKYVYTPQGIFELKFFFNSSINRSSGGDALSSMSVQEKIKKIIEGEQPNRPYSDEKIAAILNQEEKIEIARRTVAKYREMMGILPSNKRKQV
ncbi:MAG: RNA polymerase factor sigma-54 [Desulfobacterales bacterium]|nr:RNA polymerase factor sigma-54 [Desulfobacterales bacterium]